MFVCSDPRGTKAVLCPPPIHEVYKPMGPRLFGMRCLSVPIPGVPKLYCPPPPIHEVYKPMGPRLFGMRCLSVPIPGVPKLYCALPPYMKYTNPWVLDCLAWDVCLFPSQGYQSCTVPSPLIHEVYKPMGPRLFGMRCLSVPIPGVPKLYCALPPYMKYTNPWVLDCLAWDVCLFPSQGYQSCTVPSPLIHEVYKPMGPRLFGMRCLSVPIPGVPKLYCALPPHTWSIQTHGS